MKKTCQSDLISTKLHIFLIIDKGMPDRTDSTIKNAIKDLTLLNGDIPIYNVEDILKYIELASIIVFTFTKDDVGKK